MTDRPAKYETVTFEYSENGPGGYKIMVTEVQRKDNDVFADLTFPERTFLYQFWDGREFKGGPHFRGVDNQITAPDDKHLRNLFHAIDSGEIALSEITDGETLEPIDIRQMVDNGQD